MAFAIVGTIAIAAAATKAGVGIAKGIAGSIQAKKAAKAQAKAQKALDKNKVYASQYMAHDSQEYFAEQFGLYFMDRKDLVDPKFKNLIEDILKEANDIN